MPLSAANESNTSSATPISPSLKTPAARTILSTCGRCVARRGSPSPLPAREELELRSRGGGHAGELLCQRPTVRHHLLLPPARDAQLADRSHQGGVLDARDPRHPREARIRCDVRIGIDLENPGVPIL